MAAGLEETTATILPHLLSLKGARKLIAVAGPPGAGKTSVSASVHAALEAAGHHAAVVPMDGFHLDNRLLRERGLLARKGSPDSFDAAGFLHLVGRVAAGEDVIYPVFDRKQDIAIAGAAHLPAGIEFVIFEGNYLLLEAPIWRNLRPLWSFSIRLDTPRAVLEARLLQRWLDHGLTGPDARARRDANDMPNADLVLTRSAEPDLALPN